MMLQGDPNASIPTVEPVIMRPQFGVSPPPRPQSLVHVTYI